MSLLPGIKVRIPTQPLEDVPRTPEGADQILERVSRSLDAVYGAQGTKVQLTAAQQDLLLHLELVCKLADDILRNPEPGRPVLKSIFGGDCSRIALIRATIGEIQGTMPNASDEERLRACLEICDAVEKILQDLGYGEALKRAKQAQELFIAKRREALTPSPSPRHPISFEMDGEAGSAAVGTVVGDVPAVASAGETLEMPQAIAGVTLEAYQPPATNGPEVELPPSGGLATQAPDTGTSAVEPASRAIGPGSTSPSSSLPQSSGGVVLLPAPKPAAGSSQARPVPPLAAGTTPSALPPTGSATSSTAPAPFAPKPRGGTQSPSAMPTVLRSPRGAPTMGASSPRLRAAPPTGVPSHPGGVLSQEVLMTSAGPPVASGGPVVGLPRAPQSLSSVPAGPAAPSTAALSVHLKQNRVDNYGPSQPVPYTTGAAELSSVTAPPAGTSVAGMVQPKRAATKMAQVYGARAQPPVYSQTQLTQGFPRIAQPAEVVHREGSVTLPVVLQREGSTTIPVVRQQTSVPVPTRATSTSLPWTAAGNGMAQTTMARPAPLPTAAVPLPRSAAEEMATGGPPVRSLPARLSSMPSAQAPAGPPGGTAKQLQQTGHWEERERLVAVKEKVWVNEGLREV